MNEKRDWFEEGFCVRFHLPKSVDGTSFIDDQALRNRFIDQVEAEISVLARSIRQVTLAMMVLYVTLFVVIMLIMFTSACSV